MQFHFRSIEILLDGICNFHCPEHPWDSACLAIAAAAGKRSIFSSQDDGEDCNWDRDAGEDDEELDHGDSGGDDDGDEISSADIGVENTDILPQPSISTCQRRCDRGGCSACGGKSACCSQTARSEVGKDQEVISQLPRPRPWRRPVGTEYLTPKTAKCTMWDKAMGEVTFYTARYYLTITSGIFLQAFNPRSRGEEKYSGAAWDIRPWQSFGLCRVDRRGN